MPNAAPYTPPNTLTPSQASYISKKARKAVRAGLLSHHQFAVLEALLWDARKHGEDRATAAYGWLQKLANVCRQVAVDAIKAGVRLGLLRKVKHKTLTLWANGGRKWRQQPNEYVFCCESTAQTESPKEEIKIYRIEANHAEIASAQVVLAERRRVTQQRLLTKGAVAPS